MEHKDRQLVLILLRDSLLTINVCDPCRSALRGLERQALHKGLC